MRRGMRVRWNHFAAGLAVATFLAGPAAALGIQISGPTEANVGDTVTFTISLDELSTITGYELFASWDPNELQWLPDVNGSSVMGNLFISEFLPFVTPTLGQLPTGSDNVRFSNIGLSAIPTTALFRLDFEVLAGADDLANNDGLLDFWIDLETGGGVSGEANAGLLPIDLDAGVAVNSINSVGLEFFQCDVSGGQCPSVPEPSLALLTGVGLIGLGGALRWRR